MNKIPVINQIIKDKRKKIKLTQSEFAKLINKSPTSVKRYDTGDIIPDNTLILICKKLNLNLLTLLLNQKKENETENTNNYKELIDKNKTELFLKDSDNKFLENLGNELFSLYKLFYNEEYNKIIPSVGFKTDFSLTYKIIDDNIIILKKIDNRSFDLSTSKINLDYEYEEINSFTLKEATLFIKEIKNYFNYRNDMHKFIKEQI